MADIKTFKSIFKVCHANWISGILFYCLTSMCNFFYQGCFQKPTKTTLSSIYAIAVFVHEGKLYCTLNSITIYPLPDGLQYKYKWHMKKNSQKY